MYKYLSIVGLGLSLLIFSSSPITYAQDGGDDDPIEEVVVVGQRPPKRTFTIFINTGGGEVVTPFYDVGAHLGDGGGGSDSGDDDQNGDDCSDSGSGGGSTQNKAGNPINFLTGNKFETENDFQGGGRLPLEITRNYNSKSGFGDIGLLGRRWTSNIDMALTTLSPSNGQERVKISMPDGAANYLFQADDRWYFNNGAPAQLAKTSDNYWLFFKNGTTYTFKSSGQIYSVADEYGYSLEFFYNSTGTQLLKVKRNDNTEISFTYYSNGLIKTAKDPNNNIINYYYSTNKDLIKVTYPGNQSRNYAYDAYGRLVSLTDERGIVFARWSYDGAGRGIQSYHGNVQEKHNFAYSTNYTTVTNPLGKQTRYNFQTIKGKKKVVSVVGYPKGSCLAANQAYTYDAQGNRDIVTDWKGDKTDYDYNAFGHLIKKTEAVGTPHERVETREYWLGFTGKPTKIDTPLMTKEFEFDSMGRVTKHTQLSKVTTPSSSATKVWNFSYVLFSSGLVKKKIVDGPRSDVSDIKTYEYDIKGNLIKVISALGHVTSYSNYDNSGRVGRTVEPNGRISDYVYNSRGWLIQSKVNSGATQRVKNFTYDASGLLTKVTRADGSLLNLYYDSAQRLIKATDSNNKKKTYTYDLASNITSKTVHDLVTHLTLVFIADPVLPGGGSGDCGLGEICGGFGGGGFGAPPPDDNPSGTWVAQEVTDEQPITKTNYEYDALSRLSKLIEGEGQTEEYGYRTDNLLSSEKDGFGQEVTYSYNSRKLLEWIRDSNNKYTKYFYDAENRVIRVQDPNGRNTHYDRDGFGQVWRLRSPDTGTTTFEYDAAGNVTKSTNANGVIVTYTYDALNRIKTSLSDDVMSQSYTYDTDRNGHLYKVTNSSGYTQFWNNDFGELTRRYDVIEGIGHNTYWTYDKEGRVKDLTYPDGRKITYGYDNNGNVNFLSTQRANSDVVTIIIGDAEYRPFGPINTLSYGNGEIRSYERDKSARILELESGNNIAYSYGYDANNNIESITDVADASQDRTYSYDVLQRLKTHTGPDGSFSYGFDNNGNRKTLTENGSTTTSYYTSGSNKLYKNGNVDYLLDAAGNTKQIGSRVFTYNAENRLSRVTNGSLVVDYKYNSFGQRVYKSKGATKTYYIYGQNGQLLYETKNGVKTDYIYFNNELVAVDRNNVIYYVHSDHQGRPQVVTNSNQIKVWEAQNNAYGRTVTYELGEFNVGFPGQYWDEDTGLFYNYFRDYDPSIGRYIQSDPIGLFGGLNTYAYVMNNPMSFVDPYGLSMWRWARAGAGHGARTGGTIGSAGGGIGAAPGAVIGALIGGAVGAGGYLLADKVFNEMSDGENEASEAESGESSDGGECEEGESESSGEGQRGLPTEGEPGEWVDHPHGKQSRKYGPDGKPQVDIDRGHDHGQGSPHAHNWVDGVRGPGHPVSEIPKGN